MADKPMERRGLSKLAPPQKMSAGKMGKPDPLKEPGAPAGKVGGEKGEPANGGEPKTHTITEHGDGSHTTEMHDGTKTEHPDHLHMLAHVGHHMTGGDKHHIAHHDGMGITSHGIHETGEHDGPHEHASGDEAGAQMASFMGGDDEKAEGEAPVGGEHEMEQTYGGM